MTMTGAIMMTISTDMYHHCGPRVVFCAATSTGMVWAFALERKSASRILVPGQDEDEHEGRGQPGAHKRQRDGEEHPELRSAVDLGALLEVERHAGEEVARQPDDDRQVDAGIGRDQRELGVEQLKMLEHHVDRQHRDDRRHDPVRDHPELDVVVANRGLEAPNERAKREQEERDRDGERDLPGRMQGGDRDDDRDQKHKEGHDRSKLDLEIGCAPARRRQARR